MKHLSICDTTIRQDDCGRFSLNDLHRASGGEAKHQPAFFLRNDQTKMLIDELCSAEMQITPVMVVKGNHSDGRKQGTYVCRELVIAYAAWISPAFHLQVIRTFDAVTTGGHNPTVKAKRPSQVFRDYFGVARLIGMDKPLAAIAANKATVKLSGVNFLEDLDAIHIESPMQEVFLTPSEIGGEIGMSGRAINRALVDLGYQTKAGDHWAPTDKGAAFGRLYDTGKAHTDGTPIQQLKWAACLVDSLRQNGKVED